jgi:hypothetical protein
LHGNCILGILSTKACIDLSPSLKNAIQNSKLIEVNLTTSDHQDSFFGYGHPNLLLSNETSIVFRTSTFISDRTILIKCSKAARDIDPNIKKDLTNPTQNVSIKFFEKVE